ncbi:hypothetical protein DFJ77DRAFT_550344 [Powellomyces hirtus]|nr:hypothetical protein DFJ77DRAFT_550344 [Powellomyces hirtus]
MIRDWDEDADEWDELERVQKPWVSHGPIENQDDARRDRVKNDNIEESEQPHREEIEDHATSPPHTARSLRGTMRVRETIREESSINSRHVPPPPWAGSGGLKDMFTPLSLETLFYQQQAASTEAGSDTDTRYDLSHGGGDVTASSGVGDYDSLREAMNYNTHGAAQPFRLPSPSLEQAFGRLPLFVDHDDLTMAAAAATRTPSDAAVSFGISASNIMNGPDVDESPSTGPGRGIPQAHLDSTPTPRKPLENTQRIAKEHITSTAAATTLITTTKRASTASSDTDVEQPPEHISAEHHQPRHLRSKTPDTPHEFVGNTSRASTSRGHESLFHIDYDTRTRRYLKALVDELHNAPVDALTARERTTSNPPDHEWTIYPDDDEDNDGNNQNSRAFVLDAGVMHDADAGRVCPAPSATVNDTTLKDDPLSPALPYPSDIDFLEDAFNSSRRNSQRDSQRSLTRPAANVPAAYMVSNDRHPHRRSVQQHETPQQHRRTGSENSDPTGKQQASTRLVTIRNLNKGGPKPSVMLSQLAAHSQMTFNEDKHCWEGPDGLIEDLLDGPTSVPIEDEDDNQQPETNIQPQEWNLREIIAQQSLHTTQFGNEHLSDTKHHHSADQAFLSPASVKLHIEDLTQPSPVAPAADPSTTSTTAGSNLRQTPALYGGVRGPRRGGSAGDRTSSARSDPPPMTPVAADRCLPERTLDRQNSLRMTGQQPPSSPFIGSKSVIHARNSKLLGVAGVPDMHALQFLDISGNALQDLSSLTGLVNLRELHAASNELTTCRHLIHLPRLAKVNLRCNKLDRIDMGVTDIPNLEVLDVSCNRLTTVAGIEILTGLREFLTDQNRIELIDLQRPIPGLEILSMNDNSLHVFDGKFWPRLRRLALDRNPVVRFAHEDNLKRLRYLSMENQVAGDVHSTFGLFRQIDFAKLISLTDLHMSNLHLGSIGDLRQTTQLQRLSLQGAGLIDIPRSTARALQQLVHLDLQDNSIADLGGLKYLKHLRSLCLTGNNVADFGALIHAVGRMSRLEVLDVRDNPITRRFYPNPPSEGPEWETQDEEFQRGLPDADYVRRLCYRSSLISVLKGSLRLLDSISTAEIDIQKAKMHMKRLKSSLRRSLNSSTGPPRHDENHPERERREPLPRDQLAQEIE